MVAANPAHGSSASKICHFFEYATENQACHAQIWMPAETHIPHHSPWFPLLQAGRIKKQPIFQPNLILLSDAADWHAASRIYGSKNLIPKLHLIGGNNLRYLGHQALNNPAIRVAMGNGIANLFEKLDIFKEPLHILPIGLDQEDLPTANQKTHNFEILILSDSNPSLGLAIQQNLERFGLSSACELSTWPTMKRQEAIAMAAVVVILAPAPGQASLGLRRLTAMGYQTPIVCEEMHPDDKICKDGFNCLITSSNPASLAAAAASLVDPTNIQLQRKLIDGGLATLVRHRRTRERLEFNQLLYSYKRHWQTACACNSEQATKQL